MKPLIYLAAAGAAAAAVSAERPPAAADSPSASAKAAPSPGVAPQINAASLPPAATLAPPQCLARFASMGLPSFRSDSAAVRQVVICRRGYAASVDEATREPSWVIERLTASELTGKAKRRDNFKADPLLKVAGGPQVSDYPGRPYDKGHQAPAQDAAFDQSVMDESFYMSNMGAQFGVAFNQGIWRLLEKSIRDAVLCGGREEAFVITGPLYRTAPQPGPGGRVPIPDGFFKIAYDAAQGRAVGYMMENRNLSGHKYPEYVVPISQIEEATGLDFFPALTERSQTVLESGKGVVWGHNATCKGDA